MASNDLLNIEKRLPMMIASAMRVVITQLINEIRLLREQVIQLKTQVRRLENEKLSPLVEEEDRTGHRWPKPRPPKYQYLIHDKG